jgi:hypothetical protein
LILKSDDRLTEIFLGLFKKTALSAFMMGGGNVSEIPFLICSRLQPLVGTQMTPILALCGDNSTKSCRFIITRRIKHIHEFRIRMAFSNDEFPNTDSDCLMTPHDEIRPPNCVMIKFIGSHTNNFFHSISRPRS